MDFLFNLGLFLIGIPAVMFCIECLLGFFSTPPNPAKIDLGQKRTVILIPAHNEEAVLRSTLDGLKAQLGTHDSVVVVADNCNDTTADIVREYGYTALERVHGEQHGKGYALDYGIQHLKKMENPPDIVIIVDADCQLGEDSIMALKRQVVATGRPTQACYLMHSGDVARMSVKIAEFAFLIKNKIRPRGLHRLGMPVPLTGAGMAFPFETLSQAQLATGDIVEDMRLGVELAECDLGAGYCDEALVYSYFPKSETAEKTQRERWEHGHLNILNEFVPRLLKRAIRACSLKALVMALDLLIPPLSLLVMIVFSALGFSFLWGLSFGNWEHFHISMRYLMLIGVSVALIWARYGRNILSPNELLHIPMYIASKIAVYTRFALGRQTSWIRTDRD